MEIIFHSHGNKTHFHKKGCAPSLILKVRVFRTLKWPNFFWLKSSPPAQKKMHYLLKCQSQGPLLLFLREREKKETRTRTSRRGPWFSGCLMLEIWDWFLLICIFLFFRFHFALDVEGQAFVYMHLKHEKCFISSCTTFSPCSSFSLWIST